MVLLYRILNLKENVIIGYFYEHEDARKYIECTGLTYDAIIQECNVNVDNLHIIKRVVV